MPSFFVQNTAELLFVVSLCDYATTKCDIIIFIYMYNFSLYILIYMLQMCYNKFGG